VNGFLPMQFVPDGCAQPPAPFIRWFTGLHRPRHHTRSPASRVDAPGWPGRSVLL